MPSDEFRSWRRSSPRSVPGLGQRRLCLCARLLTFAGKVGSHEGDDRKSLNWSEKELCLSNSARRNAEPASCLKGARSLQRRARPRLSRAEAWLQEEGSNTRTPLESGHGRQGHQDNSGVVMNFWLLLVADAPCCSRAARRHCRLRLKMHRRLAPTAAPTSSIDQGPRAASHAGKPHLNCRYPQPQRSCLCPTTASS